CPSNLETRVRALLDETRARSGVSRRAIAIAVVVIALMLVPLAGARPELRGREEKAISLPNRSFRAIERPVQRTVARLESMAGRVRSITDLGGGGGAFGRTKASSSGTFDATPGETLVLDLETGGNVELRGWDEPRVNVDVYLGGRDGKDTQANIE